MKKLIIGSDHAAFEAKSWLKEELSSSCEFLDVGTNSTDSCHYPEYAIKLAKEVQSSGEQGILLCGSGIGVSMVANKFQGVRAALCESAEIAKLSREHNNANVLCLAARFKSKAELKEIIDTFLNTPFEGGRHETRISMFDQLGEKLS